MQTPDTIRDTSVDTSINPTAVLIGLEPALRARFQGYLRQHGYTVAVATTGPEGRRLVRETGARLVVLRPELPAETGWLTAAKLRLEQPEAALVVVVEEHDHRARQFAHFLGARVQLRQDEGLAGLAPLMPRLQTVH